MPALAYWESVVLCAATVTDRPCWLIEKLFTLSPAGSFGMSKLMGGSVLLPPRIEVMSPPPPLSPGAFCHVMLTCVPVILTVPIWVRLIGPTVAVALILSGPAADRCRSAIPPAWLVSAVLTEEKDTNATPVMLSTSPPLNELLMWTPLACALTLEMDTGPAGMSLALMSISCRFRAMTWVKNGNPWMLTDGLIAESADLIWLAI